MLKLHTMSMEPSNVKKKKKIKGTIIYDKRIVTCDVEIAQCEDGTDKNVRKKLGNNQM